MANRFTNPVPQFLDGSGLILAGAKCYFYVTGTSTPANTYTTEALSIANANPLVADSAGRLPACFLDPAVTYKVVLKTSADVEVWSRDPVVDLAANVTAKFQVHAGDPNGNVAGTAGTVGGAGASVVWDITNDLLYVCTTSGTASTAVWTLVAATLSGQVAQTGVITPTTLAANTDNWNPTGLSTASVIRMGASSAVNLTGIVAQPTGTLLTLHNIGTFAITLTDDATSTAANRFDLPRDTVVNAGGAITLRYDGVSSRWRPTSSKPEIAAAADMETATSTVLAVPPGLQQRHPLHPKCWGMFSGGASPALVVSGNITSITDTAAGRVTVTIATDFSSTGWALIATFEVDGTPGVGSVLTCVEASGSKAAGSVIIEFYSDIPGGTLADAYESCSFVGLGDQA